MKEKSLKSIEYNIITQQLSELCVFNENKELAVKLVPFTDIEEVGESLLCTDTVMSYMLKYGNPSLDSAYGCYDAVVHSTKGGMLSCAELLTVARMYRNFDRIKKWYLQYERNSDVMDWTVMSMTENPQLEKLIFDSILSDNQVADTASDELYDIRRKIKKAESAVRERLESYIRNTFYQKYLQEAVITIRQNKFVIPVKAEYKNEINGTVHDVSSSGSTYFIEPAAVAELNNKIMQLFNEEQDEINRILTRLSTMVAQNSVMFFDSYEKMLKIDMVVAKAKLAMRQNAVMPKINSDLKFSLKKARHPLIDKKVVVPTDIEIGFDYDTMIITGPNTGGKTVSLKTAGLLCAMACTGMLIPAHESSSVCVFENILVDIGDEQSIEQSLSTFSGHMKNIGTILKQANDKSLVLMDELGAGTDPAEGAALALSIIEKLRSKGSKVMATTHYGELKVYALETQGVQNASCEFDTNTLMPTYKIIMGVPGKSNAFYISKRLGIDDDIIENAKRHLSEDEKRLDGVLAQLEDLKKQLKAGHDEIEMLKDYAGNKMKQAEEKSAKILKEAQAQADAITEKAKLSAQKVQDEAYRLSDELKVLQKQENISAQQRLQKAREIARKDTAKLISSVEKDETDVIALPKVETVKKGDRVVIGSLNKQAVAQGPANKDGMVDVMAGVIKTRVHISDLYQDIAPAPKQKQSGGMRNVRQGTRNNTTSAATRNASMEINVIGQTVDEAIIEVDRFLDNCFMNRQHTVYIIHGKGTGALRSGIHQFLKKHKHVSYFRLGTYGEGEAGVTVVELK
ncbi:MAG: endonuclease MutS2 [Oscillospiraceae bacterium]|nr:endonuclease MutS2 [Oscillospiraceae bacterium]